MNLVKFDENNYNVINTVYVHLFFISVSVVMVWSFQRLELRLNWLLSCAASVMPVNAMEYLPTMYV